MNKFPTIGDYNQAIQKNGNLIFSTLSSVELIPSRTLPIKVFLFGSGAYAAVFKGKIFGKLFALRVFLEAGSENVSRYEKICSHLENLNSTWKVNCEFLPNEISVKNEKYPILKMNWIEGKLINDFVTENLHSLNVLNNLQREIVNVAYDLDKNNIGHGDIQSGNIIIVGSAANFQLKLIDYDGMFTPNQNTIKSIENGRSEFNHPERSKNHFGPFVDRFPFWVMLCTLEALKYDTSLWKEVMQGGFNTLDNFLFLRSDFVNPNTSELVKRLKKLKSDSVDFYLGRLLEFGRKSIYDTALPQIHSDKQTSNSFDPLNKNEHSDLKTDSKDHFSIKCDKPGIKILSSNLEKIGSLPLELDKKKYSNKTIIATDGNQLKRIELLPNKNTIQIEWIEKVNISCKSNTNYTASQNRKSHPNTEKESSYSSSKNNKSSNSSNSSNSNSQNNSTSSQTSNTNRNEKYSRNGTTPSEKTKKPVNNSLSWLLSIVIIILVMACVTSYFRFYEFNINSAPPNKEVSIIAVQKNVIREFLKAEDRRNWEKIKSLFSPVVRRYWDLKAPYHYEIEWKYRDIWKNTLEGKNEIERIKRVRDDQFDVHINYTYYDKFEKSYYQANSLVRFEFDNENKINATYAAKPSIPKKLNEDKADKNQGNNFSKTQKLEKSDFEKKSTYSPDPVSDSELKRVIRKFIDAEDNRDLDKLYPLIAPSPKYYLGARNPYFSEIKKSYSSKWDKTSNESIEILDIKPVDLKAYNVTLEISIYNNSNYELEIYNDIREIHFNNNNEIESYKVLKSSKVDSYRGKTTENNANPSISKRKYLYVTELEYTFGPPLRRGPTFESNKIKDCPSDTPIYVLERTNNTYYKVLVAGTIGYMSKSYLKKQ